MNTFVLLTTHGNKPEGLLVGIQDKNVLSSLQICAILTTDEDIMLGPSWMISAPLFS